MRRIAISKRGDGKDDRRQLGSQPEPPHKRVPLVALDTQERCERSLDNIGKGISVTTDSCLRGPEKFSGSRG